MSPWKMAAIAACALVLSASNALAAIGDSYVRVVFIHGVDGGEYVWYGAGTCAAAEMVLASYGHTVKECQQLVVVSGGTVANSYNGLIANPQLPALGELLNLGPVGQGIVIVWRPDGLPHAARIGPQGIELAPLQLPGAPAGTDIEEMQLRQGTVPQYWIDNQFIQGAQGDFEILYTTQGSAGNLLRQPFTISALTFLPVPVPCSAADLTTSGATAPGQPGFGVPDRISDLDDLGFFLNAWIRGCP